MIKDFRRVAAFLDADLRRRWMWLVPLTLLSAVLEAAGTLLVFAWINLVSSPAQGLRIPIGDGILVGEGLSAGRVLVYLSVTLATYFGTKSLLVLAFTHMVNRFCTEGVATVSTGLLRRYLGADYEFYFSRTTAELSNNLLSATNRVFNALARSAIEVLSESMLLLGVLAVLFYSVPGGTLVAVAVLGTVLIVCLRLTQKLFVRLGSTVHDANTALFRYAHQGLGAIKEAKLLRLEGFFAEKFLEVHREHAKAVALFGTVNSAPRLLMEALFVCILAALVVLLTVVQPQGEHTLPLLGLFAFAGFRILPAIHRILFHVNNFRYSSAPLDSLEQDWLALSSFVADPGEQTEHAFESELVFQDVSYAYPSSHTDVLRNVTLRVRAGQSVGIVGSTGAGKSTLVDLALGLLRPTKGTISADGHSLAELGRAWFHNVGYVPQDVFLIDDTIAANVGFGIPPDQIDRESVWAALRAAQLDQFVETLPDKLDTWVGERGVRLSGGQKQRVAIARALYRRPPVLVFDEATSALDSVTERDLSGTIESLGGQRTLLIVAHRITTVQHCDFIIVLHGGELRAQGTYAELMNSSDEFRALVSPENSGRVPPTSLPS